MKNHINNLSSAPTVSFQDAPFAIEQVLPIAEAATVLRWSYDSVRRYFKDLPGVLVKFQPKRYRRPYKLYMIPKSVFQREWDKMATFNAESRWAA